MKSPLNIAKTVNRYQLDADKIKLLKSFDSFIWSDFKVNSVEDIIFFEKKYIEYENQFSHCFDSEVGEPSPVYMYDGLLSLISKGSIQKFQSDIEKNCLYSPLKELGLSDLEIVIIATFLADISGLYRKDAYRDGIPPFVDSICTILNDAISKLPIYSGDVVRKCHEYDRFDFKEGDIFMPGFCLTTSKDIKWECKCNNRYKIKTLSNIDTKARDISSIYENGEKQITFLNNAKFIITGVTDWGQGKQQIEMQEIV